MNNSSGPVEYKQLPEECQKFIDGVLETAMEDRRHDQTVEEGTSQNYCNCANIYNNISFIFLFRQIT